MDALQALILSGKNFISTRRRRNMGYYSEVAFTIVGKKEDIIPELVALRLDSSMKEALDECSYRMTNAQDKLVIVYHRSSAKWNDMFDDVKALTRLYETFSEDEAQRFDCGFMRIGEDVDDVVSEHAGVGYEFMQLQRSIEMEYQHDSENTLAKLLGEPNVGSHAKVQ